MAPLLWLSLCAGAIYVLLTRLDRFALGDVGAALASVPSHDLGAAVLCCVLAFALLAFYEVIAVHAATARWLIATASTTALIANSISHVLGAAVLSGGALRYRRYTPVGLDAMQIGVVTLHSALPYLLAAGWILDLGLVLYSAEAATALQLPEHWVFSLGVLGLAKDVGWIALVSRRATVRWGSWTLQLPTLRLTLIQIAVGLLELQLVAAILFMFMPPELGMTLFAFTSLFVLAVTAAQLSHMPAGLGVLEAALLVLIPHVPPAKLIAAVLAYRAIFELLPLLIGVVLLVRAEMTSPDSRKSLPLST